MVRVNKMIVDLNFQGEGKLCKHILVNAISDNKVNIVSSIDELDKKDEQKLIQILDINKLCLEIWRVNES